MRDQHASHREGRQGSGCTEAQIRSRLTSPLPPAKLSPAGAPAAPWTAMTARTRAIAFFAVAAALWACGTPTQSAFAPPDVATDAVADANSADLLPDLVTAETGSDAELSDELADVDVAETPDGPQDSGQPDVAALSDGEVSTEPDVPADSLDTNDAANDTADTTAPAPPLTLPALLAALQVDNAAAAAPLLAQYDMPVCSGGQCLFVIVAPGAKSVAVTGDWAQWKTDTALTWAPKTAVWWALIPLQVGKKVEYKAKLDGVWALDPSNPHFAWNTFGPNSAIYGKDQSRLYRLAGVASPQLGNTRDVYVYVPAAYHTQPDAHFPVLYMQDGFNVFTNPKAPFGSWDVEQTADALMGSGEVQPVLIAGIDTADRNHEYVYSALDIAGVSYAPKLPAYTAFLVDTLKPLVDKTFRTLPDRAHTAIGGSSLGGISSLWIGWTHWQTFGLIASFSGAYWIGEPAAVWNGQKTGEGPPMRDLIADSASKPGASLRIYMDSGDTGFDGVASYGGDAWVYSDWTRNALIAAGWDSRTEYGQAKNLPVNTVMANVPSLAWTAVPKAGWKAYVAPDKNLLAVVGHGHQHNEAAWKQRVGAMLRFLWPGPGLK